MTEQPGKEPQPTTLSHSPTVTPTMTRASEYGRYSELMAQAVQVLTDAARLTWSSPGADGEPTTARVDWAEFVTLALAGAAANVGSIEAALSGRPGSWEADGVRRLLSSTVGHDEEHLLQHRTQPVAVHLYVDEIPADLDVRKAYDDAQQQLAQHYEKIAGTTPADGDEPHPHTQEQQRHLDLIVDLEERVEQLRQRDWETYGSDLKAAVEAAARHRAGLQVPTIVTVHLHTFRPAQDWCSGSRWDLTDQLRTEAITSAPLPGNGQSPLERLRFHAA